MKVSLTDGSVQSENHNVTHTIYSNLPLIQESKEEGIKNHITAIKTCVDLILVDNMGEISTIQKKNFELIKSEIEKITSLLRTSRT